MDEQTKKNLVIGVTVVCLFAASILFYRSFFGGSGGATGDGQAALMCTSCGGFELPMVEFREMISEQGLGAMMSAGAVAMECPKCGKKTCYQARKCKKCETIFVSGQAKDKKYPDRCPKCSFSNIEDHRQNMSP